MTHTIPNDANIIGRNIVSERNYANCLLYRVSLFYKKLLHWSDFSIIVMEWVEKAAGESILTDSIEKSTNIIYYISINLYVVL